MKYLGCAAAAVLVAAAVAAAAVAAVAAASSSNSSSSNKLAVNQHLLQWLALLIIKGLLRVQQTSDAALCLLYSTAFRLNECFKDLFV